MSKAYFSSAKPKKCYHTVRITLIQEQDGRTGLTVETNADEGLTVMKPPRDRTYYLPVGRSMTVVIED